MTPALLDSLIIVPSLSILPSRMLSIEARTLLISIALQESSLKYRKQLGGPAKGFWQFEEGGGVRGVMSHYATSSLIPVICQDLVIEYSQEAVYNALEYNDVLACTLARSLLYTHPASLPRVMEEEKAWEYYIELWRPGKPHKETWHKNFSLARETVVGIQ